MTIDQLKATYEEAFENYEMALEIGDDEDIARTRPESQGALLDLKQAEREKLQAGFDRLARLNRANA